MLRTIGSMALGVLIGIVIAVVCEVGHIFYADVVHNSPCMMPAATPSGSGVTEVPWIARNVVSAPVVKHKHVVSSRRITCLQGPCVYAEPALQPLCPPDSICQSITQSGGGIVAEGKSVVNVSCVDNLPCVTEVTHVK